jgi:cell wall-associated NlpC family hydrolase
MARRADAGRAIAIAEGALAAIAERALSAALVLLTEVLMRGIRLIAVLALIAVAGCASAAAKRSPDAPASATPLTPSQSRIVTTALKYVGAPYARGGSSPAGFDCSGFVMFVYARHGVALPHSAEAQYRLGAPVRRDRLRPGDIVFFDRLGHSGIYIGDGRFVHATKPGDVVKVSGIDESWYRRRWVGARRIL